MAPRGTCFRRLLAVALAAATAACGHPRDSRPANAGPRHGGELRVSEEPDLRSWDPLEAGDVVTAAVVGQVYDGLLGYDPRRLDRLVPALADRWDVLDGGRTYRFRLREAHFADDPCFPGGRGRRVTASDVRFTFERALTAKPLPEILSLVWRIHGARDLADGRARSLDGLETEADSVVVFRLTEPSAPFPHLLASNAGWIVPPEAVAAYGRDLWQHPVGAGPFRLALWDPLRRVILARNENYWATDSLGLPVPYLDRVQVSLTPAHDPLERDMPHVLRSPVLGAAGTRRTAEGNYRYLQTPRFNTLYAAWNLDRATVWAREPRLRKAVALAGCGWDEPRSALPARGMIPPGILGHRDSGGMTPDLDGARRLLAECGHPGGRGLPALQYQVLDGDEFYGSRLAARLEPLGIEVVTIPVSRPEHWSRVAAGQVDFFRGGWIADYPDPENFFEIFSSDSPRNNARFRNARYDSLFRALSAEGDEARRLTIIERLEEILFEESPAVFFCHELGASLVSPEVHGFELSVNPLSRRFFQYVWLENGQPRKRGDEERASR